MREYQFIFYSILQPSTQEYTLQGHTKVKHKMFLL